MRAAEGVFEAASLGKKAVVESNIEITNRKSNTKASVWTLPEGRFEGGVNEPYIVVLDLKMALAVASNPLALGVIKTLKEYGVKIVITSEDGFDKTAEGLQKLKSSEISADLVVQRRSFFEDFDNRTHEGIATVFVNYRHDDQNTPTNFFISEEGSLIDLGLAFFTGGDAKIKNALLGVAMDYYGYDLCGLDKLNDNDRKKVFLIDVDDNFIAKAKAKGFSAYKILQNADSLQVALGSVNKIVETKVLTEIGGMKKYVELLFKAVFEYVKKSGLPDDIVEIPISLTGKSLILQKSGLNRIISYKDNSSTILKFKDEESSRISTLEKIRILNVIAKVFEAKILKNDHYLAFIESKKIKTVAAAEERDRNFVKAMSKDEFDYVWKVIEGKLIAACAELDRVVSEIESTRPVLSRERDLDLPKHLLPQWSALYLAQSAAGAGYGGAEPMTPVSYDTRLDKANSLPTPDLLRTSALPQGSAKYRERFSALAGEVFLKIYAPKDNFDRDTKEDFSRPYHAPASLDPDVLMQNSLEFAKADAKNAEKTAARRHNPVDFTDQEIAAIILISREFEGVSGINDTLLKRVLENALKKYVDDSYVRSVRYLSKDFQENNFKVEIYTGNEANLRALKNYNAKNLSRADPPQEGKKENSPLVGMRMKRLTEEFARRVCKDNEVFDEMLGVIKSFERPVPAAYIQRPDGTALSTAETLAK